MRTATISNILLVSDLHLSDASPASRKDDYLSEVMDLLWQTVELAKEHDAHMVWAGDVFHLKTPGRNSHGMVNATIDVVKAYPCGLSIVPGNHDLSHDRLDSIPSQPLGTLFKAGAHNLQGWGSEQTMNSAVYGVPWQQRFNETTVDSALVEYRKFASAKIPHLVVTHAPLYPPGKELPYEFYDTAAWATAMGNHGSVFYGHVHNPHGVYDVERVTFCNNGALSRGSLDESNLTRPVLATLWSSVSGLFRAIPLRAQRADEIFKMEVKTKRAAQIKLDDFLASIGQASIDVTTVDSVMTYVHSLGLGPELESVIQDLIDTAS